EELAGATVDTIQVHVFWQQAGDQGHAAARAGHRGNEQLFAAFAGQCTEFVQGLAVRRTSVAPGEDDRVAAQADQPVHGGDHEWFALGAQVFHRVLVVWQLDTDRFSNGRGVAAVRGDDRQRFPTVVLEVREDQVHHACYLSGSGLHAIFTAGERAGGIRHVFAAQQRGVA